MLNGLDLFSGIGGITLALRPWVRTIAYCENDRFCHAVLFSRMRDGSIPTAPIWDDVTTFTGNLLSERPDIVFGGFPCQDISVAGTGLGLAGQRSALFFEIVRIVRDLRPPFVFLENVPVITVRGLREVLTAFSEIRYDCRWGVLSAFDMGAPHLRWRWFLLAYSHDYRVRVKHFDIERRIAPTRAQSNREGKAFITTPTSEQMGNARQSRAAHGKIPDAMRERLQRRWKRKPTAWESLPASERGNWWNVEPDVGGTFNGIPTWLDGHILNASKTNQRTAEILHYVRKDYVSKALWKTIRGHGRVQAEEILLSFMREFEAGGRISREFVAGETTPERLLRTMRENRTFISPSHKREPIEQHTRKRTDFMRLVSFMVTSQGTSPWDSPVWESGTDRVVSGMKNRVDRIRALGNAVVPVQARQAFMNLVGLADPWDAVRTD